MGIRLVSRWAPAVLLAGFLLTGCNNATTPNTAQGPAAADADSHQHDHEHQHPETYPESVAELTEMFGQIQEAFAAESPEKGDAAIHEAPHLLEELPLLAGRLTLEEAEQAEIKTAIDALSEALGKLDATVHNQEGGANWDDVGDSIEGALETLRKYIDR